ncbi:hypothetical protein EBR96_02990 [bacterium]|nr:hypothetical protein [bacterium]
MFDIDPYTDKVRPSFFPPRVDERSKKIIDIVSDADFYGTKGSASFEKTSALVQKKLDSARSGSSALSGLSEETKALIADKQAKSITGARSISKVYEGFSFIPQDILADAEQLKSRFNFEKVDDPNYVYLPDVIKPQYVPKKGQQVLEQELLDSKFFKLAEDEPGKQSTSPHNLNLFHGIGSNPIKDQDSENYQAFQKSPYYSALHTQSMTPRNILEKLDPQFWKMVNDGVDSVRHVDLGKLTSEQLAKFKNPYGDKHFGLNWQGISDPYSDTELTGIKSFDINANFHTIVSSQLWSTWDDTQVFSFVNRLWESSTRVDDVLREILGKASDMPKIGIETEGMTPEERSAVAADNKTRTQLIEKRVDQWWDKVGSGLSEAEVLPFGLLMAFTPLMQTMKDWGNWADQIESNVTLRKEGDEFGFKEQMISGYLNHTINEFVFKKFKGDGKVTAAMIGADSDKLNEAIYSDLIDQGYVDASGKLSSKFDASDPDFNLRINFSEAERDRVRLVLRQAAVGRFSLDVQDQTLVNSRPRTDIRVFDDSGTGYTLPELIDVLQSGETPYDRILNAQKVYDVLFKIHSRMVGLDTTASSNGNPILKDVSGGVEMAIADKGAWKEWDFDTKGWVEKTGELNLKFFNKEDAFAFRDQIRSLIALLEPVVGTFGADAKREGGKTFEMLVDNSGSSESVEMITDKSKNYRLSRDSLFDRSLFSSPEWKSISKSLETKVVNVIRDGIFGRGVINAISRQTHRQKREDYDAAKYEWEDREIRRMIDEMERKAKETQEYNKQQQRIKEERMRQDAEFQKKANEDRARRANEEKARNNKKKEE